MREDNQDADLEKFYSHLSGSPSDVKTAEEGGNDDAAEKSVVKKLFKVSDSTGKLQFTEVASGTLSKSSLDGNDCFVVDAGYCLFVWVGKGATEAEKSGAIENATKYAKEIKGNVNIPITRYLQGGERAEFWQQFG